MIRRSILLASSAITALTLASTAAHAAPTVKLVTDIPIGTSPFLQTPLASFFTDSTMAVSYDSDPSSPWLVEVNDQFTANGGTVARIGTVALTPSVAGIFTLPFASTDPNPDVVFAVMSDDYAYSVDAHTGACIWKTYIGRTTATTINFPGCTGGVDPSDIQCPNESDNTGFWLTADNPQDLSADIGSAASTVLYIPTNYASAVAGGDDPDFCGTTTDNRVYALRADTGAPVWTFNTDPTSATPYAGTDTPPYAVDGIVGGLLSDDVDDGCSTTNRGQLIFGTPTSGTSGQPTLFAVSVLPQTAGQLNWSSAAFGDIETEPSLHYGQAATCQHLYVTSGESLESVGITAAACGNAAVPCSLSSLPVFKASPANGPFAINAFFDPTVASLYGKLAVANQSTLSVITDNGKTLSTYCTATSLASSFPSLGPSPVPFGSSIWTGALDRNGNGALVGLEIPTTQPKTADCGKSFVSLALPGAPSDPATDFDSAGNRVLYIAANGSASSDLIVADFTE